MTEDEMVGWHHRLNGHEPEQTPGDSEGQGSLVYCSPWGRKESDVTKHHQNDSTTRFFSTGFTTTIIFRTKNQGCNLEVIQLP